jgi:hypothetical protein
MRSTSSLKLFEQPKMGRRFCQGGPTPGITSGRRPRARLGPFYFIHPDHQISNILFDDEFNITALLDWSACQTAPLESFLRQPEKVIAEADEMENWKWAELQHWPEIQLPGRSKAPALFLEVFKRERPN